MQDNMRENIGDLTKGVLLERKAKNPTASIRQLLNDIATSNPELPIYDEKTMKRNVGNLVRNMLREKGIAQGKEPKEQLKEMATAEQNRIGMNAKYIVANIKENVKPKREKGKDNGPSR